jgi:hypothetical protein
MAKVVVVLQYALYMAASPPNSLVLDVDDGRASK